MKNKDRYFFTGLAIWFFIITLLGFSSSFYLPSIERQMSFHLKIHGFIFTLWVVLFLIQVILISANKRSIHITLGGIGVFLSFAIFFSGIYTSLVKTPMYVTEVGDNLAYILTFLIFVLLGLKNKRKPHIHKRHLVFATTILTSAAVARVSVYDIDFRSNAVNYYLLTFLPIFALFIYDLLYKKTIYRVTVFDSFFIIFMLFFTNFVFQTESWARFIKNITALIK